MKEAQAFGIYLARKLEGFLKGACSRVQVVADQQQQQSYKQLRAGSRKQPQKAGDRSNSRKQEAAGEKRRRAVRPSSGPAEGLRRRGEADEVVWPSALVQKESVCSGFHKMPREPYMCIVRVPVFRKYRDFAPDEVRRELENAVSDALVDSKRSWCCTSLRTCCSCVHRLSSNFFAFFSLGVGFNRTCGCYSPTKGGEFQELRARCPLLVLSERSRSYYSAAPNFRRENLGVFLEFHGPTFLRSSVSLVSPSLLSLSLVSLCPPLYRVSLGSLVASKCGGDKSRIVSRF